MLQKKLEYPSAARRRRRAARRRRRLRGRRRFLGERRRRVTRVPAGVCSRVKKTNNKSDDGRVHAGGDARLWPIRHIPAVPTRRRLCWGVQHSPSIPEDTSFDECGDWRRARVVTKWLPVLSPGLSLDPKPKEVRPKPKLYFTKRT